MNTTLPARGPAFPELPDTIHLPPAPGDSTNQDEWIVVETTPVALGLRPCTWETAQAVRDSFKAQHPGRDFALLHASALNPDGTLR